MADPPAFVADFVRLTFVQGPLSIRAPALPNGMYCHFKSASDSKMVNPSYVVQYRPSSMCSPNPLMRPCLNLPQGFGLDWAAPLLPTRDPAMSARIRHCFDYFVHAMVCSLDKEGRPVSQHTMVHKPFWWSCCRKITSGDRQQPFIVSSARL